MERITADLQGDYKIKKSRVGRPKKAKEPRAYKNHGESSIWQFKFPKTGKNELIADLFSVKTREEFENKFGIKIDEDLEWKNGMKFITENILITLARRGHEQQH